MEQLPISAPIRKQNLPVLSLCGLRQGYARQRTGKNFSVEVDQLELQAGQFVAIQGPNGSGKTTLLNALALLRRPTNLEQLQRFEMTVPAARPGTEPQIVDVASLWRTRWRRPLEQIRCRCIGYAPQQLELLPNLRVCETIAAPLWLNGVAFSNRRQRVEELTERFGLTEAGVTHSRIGRVSGGQQQKTALARAIAHRPTLLFLDEPTAYLYHADAREALCVLQQLQCESRAQDVPLTVVMVTHDRRLADDFATCLIEMAVRTSDGGRCGYVARVESRETAVLSEERES